MCTLMKLKQEYEESNLILHKRLRQSQFQFSSDVDVGGMERRVLKVAYTAQSLYVHIRGIFKYSFSKSRH